MFFVENILLNNVFETEVRKNNKISQILDTLFYKDISNLVYDYSYHNLNSSINHCWKMLHEKYDLDFLTISDENMTSNAKWTNEF